MAELTDQKLAVLQTVKRTGRKGLNMRRGEETVTVAKLVEEGLLWQEHGPIGCWKFTLSPAGKAALSGKEG